MSLFYRSEQQARERQVIAQISAREALLTAAEREIEPELWRATHGAAGKAETVRASRCLLDNADTAYNIAMSRFTSSVGSVLEMLSAQKMRWQAPIHRQRKRTLRRWQHASV